MRYTLGFQNKKSGKLWVKSFNSYVSAKRAQKGIEKKTGNVCRGMQKSKGFYYRTELLKVNKKSKW